MIEQERCDVPTCDNPFYARRQELGRPLIASHRGVAGGNVIQNTTMAYLNAIRHGADIIELDVIRSVDGEYFAFHDGQERVVLGEHVDIRTMTAQEISSYPCINANGQYVSQRIERIGEILPRLRGKCLMNIDRSWFFWEEFLDVLDVFDMWDQIILKSPPKRTQLALLAKQLGGILYMPIVRTQEEWELVQEYDLATIAVEMVFRTADSPLLHPDFLNRLRAQQYLLWVNTLTLDDTEILSAGWDDNTAIKEGPETSWGHLLDLGFDVLLTDWPAMMRQFITERTNVR